MSRPDDRTSELREVYVRSLIRGQLRRGLIVSAVVAGGLAVVPLLFAFAPALWTVTVFGVGLVWVVLGVAVYPVVLLAGWMYVWRTERGEREFVELVEQS
ncbi:hypothetical protein F0L68_17195 [Solihabitans fulvus]|uniref:Uncharacterized protein n=1 Tax=Solihabitans fulvus TaxID=1892852 RepID=A0A5B2XEM5_9PSEU|nr:hypothetical protein [Solihabitans fulvus]KAA2261509.1 hypothetical protein F0L68_17195 [Solihabitans fulvus]